MTVKPIFIVKTPSMLTMEVTDKIKHGLKDQLDGYYVIIVQGDTGEFEFECFYEKDFNHVKYEELKQIIKESCVQ